MKQSKQVRGTTEGKDCGIDENEDPLTRKDMEIELVKEGNVMVDDVGYFKNDNCLGCGTRDCGDL